jgi:tRNA pseudouridine32 synthase/23S rRNA pseudouridine746 synthase
MYKLIYENTDFIIISKKQGIEFHGEDELLDLIRSNIPECYGVHRLDKDTSGLMVFAKNKSVQSLLSKKFSDRKVTKKYLAFSKSKPSKKQGMVKGDLVKSRNGSYKMTRSLENPSITTFKSYYIEKFGLRLFDLYPKTGKTHQLRVVMKSLGASILGDKRYKGEASDRMYLHAYFLSFEFNDEVFSFEDFDIEGELFDSGEMTNLLIKLLKN